MATTTINQILVSTIRATALKILLQMHQYVSQQDWSKGFPSFRLSDVHELIVDDLIKSKVINYEGNRPKNYYFSPNQIRTLKTFRGIESDQLYDVSICIYQTLWELYKQGVIAPSPWLPDTPRLSKEFFELELVMLTEFGQQVAESSRTQIPVYDPDGYLAIFNASSPPPDPEMQRYIQESLAVFRNGHLFAAVVLVGIASERLLEVWAGALRDALINDNGQQWFDNRYRKQKNISDKFNTIEGKLMDVYSIQLDQEKLKDGIQGLVKLSIEQIRTARNDIAHPSGRIFTWNEVYGYLFAFAQYFLHVNKVIAFLKSNSR